MWKIGNVEIANPIIAAPMAGISNPVFRTVCHEYGAGLCVSEMISDKALHYQNERTFDMCRTAENEHPVSLQLFSGDPETAAEAAEYLDQHSGCDIIDINMGCPVNKVLKAHAGSYLLDEPDTAAEIVRAVLSHTHKPVTVKMRAGKDPQHLNAPELAKRFEDAGVSMIAVHGRTRSQMYEGKVHPEYIRMVKEAVHIPVAANGDIRTVEDMKRMFEETGCDAVMIGRGLLGRPYFIEEALASLENRPWQEPSYAQRIQMCREYAVRLCADRGEHKGIRMMRGMGAWYIAGIPYSTSCKKEMSGMQTLEDLNRILDSFEECLRKNIL